MAGSSDDSKDLVLEYMWSNQISDVDGEKNNYLSQMSEELELHIDTVTRAVNWLEKWGFVKTWREGNKRMARVTTDLSQSPKGEEIED